MQTGKIGVTTENIFPIIKKFLYSEHDIFIRELVSNAVDASQKLKTLSSLGEAKGELGELKVKVSFDAENKSITIEDNGIGMSQEEVEKYINQIAFSGAEEFIEKYKDQNAIIGHFGLGFYSSFMVSKLVEIRTKSFREGSQAIMWSCDGSPEYTITEIEKEERGTAITLYLDADSEEFADKQRIELLLNKYCRFLPVPIIFGKEQEWKDGGYVDTDRDLVINDTKPLWSVSPSEIEPQQYDEFYQKLYPMSEKPLFNIHLNVDYPFNLTGILYFPKIKNNFEIQKNKIQIYCNQVFVTDTVDGIVPEFLTLLHGVIDSPDIPLNVSRSYLQGDPNVKKISSHITKKVADRLQEIFNQSREDFEQKWDDLKLFIQYGVISEEKFAERASNFLLLKNSEGEYYTIEEYKTKISTEQTDKNEDVICLYATNTDEQFSFIAEARQRGYDVLIMDSPLETHFIGWAESKNEKFKFVRVDSASLDKLIEKDTKQAMSLSTQQQSMLSPLFESVLPQGEQHYHVEFEAMDEKSSPVIITRDEMMRRMKDMARVGGSNSPYAFYANMPDSYKVIVNGNHSLVHDIFSELDQNVGEQIKKLDSDIETQTKKVDALKETIKDTKEEDLSQEEKDMRDELTSQNAKLKTERLTLIKQQASKIDLAGQLIDLALLSNGLLKGESLSRFIKRSVDILNK